MPTVRRAEVEWIGGLIDGEGKIVSTTTGALPELEVTWQSRIDEDQPQTSPEELLAAAHASCFAMQFTSGLVGAGWDPEEMHGLLRGHVRDRGRDHRRQADRAASTVDGLTDEQIYEIAQRAKIMCPISRALAGVEITLELPDLAPLEDEDEDDEEARRDWTRPTRPERLDATAGRRRPGGRAHWPGLRLARPCPRLEKTRRGARALLPRGAGADVRPCGLQRPPRGGGGRPPR